MSSTTPPVRVMLVDDEPLLRSLLRMMLHRTGRYEVVGEAGDGREALELASAITPDLVLLDLSMPRMDGLEALPHLRRLVPQAHVIVLSGFAAASAATTATAAGAHGYLEKGLAPANLVEALDESLRQPASSACADRTAAPGHGQVMRPGSGGDEPPPTERSTPAMDPTGEG